MTDLGTDFSDVERLQAEVKELQRQMFEKSKEAFKDVTEKIFQRHPSLESFGWHQYTPYFNDGDECVFGVWADEWSLKINGTNEDYLHEYLEDTLGLSYGTPEYEAKEEEFEKQHKALSKEIAGFINAFDEGVLKQMFGDHVEITVYKDRVEVDEYYHD